MLLSLFNKLNKANHSSWKDLAAKLSFIAGIAAVFTAVAALSVRDVFERIGGGGFQQTGILSDSGRFYSWSRFLDLPETAKDWLLGLGPGASAEFGQRELYAFAQTLNEYLRFLVDQGVVGLLLFIVGLALLIIRAKPFVRIQNAPSNAAGLTIVALTLVSITDGAFYSYFVVLPASILIGYMLNLHPLKKR
jgi:hypothetical protein